MSNSVALIEATLDGLDPCTTWRVYITYKPDATPVKVFIYSESGMLPSHLKSLSWLLAVRNPVKIIFRSSGMESAECLLGPIPTRKQVRKGSFFHRSGS